VPHYDAAAARRRPATAIEIDNRSGDAELVRATHDEVAVGHDDHPRGEPATGERDAQVRPYSSGLARGDRDGRSAGCRTANVGFATHEAQCRMTS
jgi:hypothetical protein